MIFWLVFFFFFLEYKLLVFNVYIDCKFSLLYLKHAQLVLNISKTYTIEHQYGLDILYAAINS
jgi:hypothetical protein